MFLLVLALNDSSWAVDKRRPVALRMVCVASHWRHAVHVRCLPLAVAIVTLLVGVATLWQHA